MAFWDNTYENHRKGFKRFYVISTRDNNCGNTSRKVTEVLAQVTEVNTSYFISIGWGS